MRTSKKQRFLTIILGFLLCLAFPQSAHAEEIENERTGLEVIFVIDCSGSMKTNDPSRVAVRMVQAFIDSVHTEELLVGFAAYNDTVAASAAPVSITDQEERQKLKDSIDAVPYSGDTDIGLGLSYVQEQMPEQAGYQRVIVLISDGETDLKAGGSRTVEDSNAEQEACVLQCMEEEIPIYTIAFGKYDGNKEVLTNIAERTDGESYTVESPEKLIEVLYGILENNVAYKIQQFSNGIYAGGTQEIKCILDEPYLDEIDVLLISEGEIGETFLKYGDSQIPMNMLSNYAVGKIDESTIRDSVKELTIHVSTAEKQKLQVFLLSYRKLAPILEIETHIPKNQEIPYRIYFRDSDGNIIEDEAFYKSFSWELKSIEDETEHIFIQPSVRQSSRGVEGTVKAGHSGVYTLSGILSDSMGRYPFLFSVETKNNPPSGELPEISCTVLDKELFFDLNTYFADADGDDLTYALEGKTGNQAAVELTADDRLWIKPEQTGTQTAILTVYDGEDTWTYPLQITIIPLWKAYWWVTGLIVSAVLFAGIAVYHLLHKPKPKEEPELLVEEKKAYRFCGRMDAYFTLQPESEKEIPPLTFQMHKVRDNKIVLGDLLEKYPKAADALGLFEICLVADEDRRMVLYHTSESVVMIGNSIACRKIRYNVSFGDIIYITSPDGMYDLEIHYIAIFQE